MNTNALAAAIVGFLLGGLTVATAAELDNDDSSPEPGPGHHQAHQR